MKKIITPSVSEHSVYFSDFSGKCFGNYLPEVMLNISFGYGSKHDETVINLHLTDEEILPILQIIKNNLSKDSSKYNIIP